MGALILPGNVVQSQFVSLGPPILVEGYDEADWVNQPLLHYLERMDSSEVIADEESEPEVASEVLEHWNKDVTQPTTVRNQLIEDSSIANNFVQVYNYPKF